MKSLPISLPTLAGWALGGSRSLAMRLFGVFWHPSHTSKAVRPVFGPKRWLERLGAEPRAR